MGEYGACKKEKKKKEKETKLALKVRGHVKKRKERRVMTFWF